MGAFEDINNKLKGKRKRRRRFWTTRLVHVYRCVETVDFIHNGQDIYNGYRIFYQKGQKYYFNHWMPDDHVLPDAHKYFRLLQVLKVRED